jgi:hypothetical protein
MNSIDGLWRRESTDSLCYHTHDNGNTAYRILVRLEDSKHICEKAINGLWKGKGAAGDFLLFLEATACETTGIWCVDSQHRIFAFVAHIDILKGTPDFTVSLFPVLPRKGRLQICVDEVSCNVKLKGFVKITCFDLIEGNVVYG